MFAWRCFPLMGLELRFFGVDGGFPPVLPTIFEDCTKHFLTVQVTYNVDSAHSSGTESIEILV